MKAGAFTPAIRVDHPVINLHDHRSMKAGAFTPAIGMSRLPAASSSHAQ